VETSRDSVLRQQCGVLPTNRWNVVVKWDCVRNPTLKATSASVFRGSASSTRACSMRCVITNSLGDIPVYARNCAAKCIGLRPAARARSRRRIGCSICDPMYCLTRANRHFGSGEIGRSWSGDFIVSLADAQVRMAEYRNRGQSLAGSLAISFAAPRACNNCSIRGSHGKNRSRRRGEPNSASLIARESAAAKPSWGPGIRQARAYSRRHADLGCPARLMRLALATALSIPDLDNSRVTP
jgi:hypothetical protein